MAKLEDEEQNLAKTLVGPSLSRGFSDSCIRSRPIHAPLAYERDLAFHVACSRHASLVEYSLL